MTGFQLKQEINGNAYLKKKGIPFLFLSTNPDPHTVDQAYDMSAQGYFVKPTSVTELHEMVQMIVNYWKICRHPV
jgi:DNA-binding NarL/FixJ family response regulator